MFRSPVETFSAYKTSEVLPALKQIEASLVKGLYVVGFISYEASPAFDPANRTRKPDGFPLLWFSSYKCFSEFHFPNDFSFSHPPVSFSPETEKQIYLKNVRKIRKYIYDGDIYQANYTFRMTGEAQGNPELLFLNLSISHPVPYSAFINAGNLKIISNSPELFLESVSGRIRSLPMKGTASRAATFDEDRKVAEDLSKDLKNRAENIMIVDMVRNDLGRICRTGSVKAEKLFHVDTYPTVHQMISEVTGRLKPDTCITDILSATFPPASITGAPKIRAMEIISGLETSPRKAYTGSIGCFMPDGDFCLNVAIRTFICSDKKTELGIGSGIVADSEPEKEWTECLMKSDFANFAKPDFKILETILWTRSKGFAFLKEHLERAQNSQEYFGQRWDGAKAKKAIRRLMSFLSRSKINIARVRLMISEDGNAETEYSVLEKTGWNKLMLKIKLSRKKTDSKDVFLYHKTTNRKLYDEEFRKAHSEGFDEVIFQNEKGEITEGAISNIFILKGGSWLTPALSCGLLPGIWRSKMICELRTSEERITAVDVKNAEKIIIGNSVRGKAEGNLIVR
ncbi:MAG: aminodeoxychorismate synthase, component I [Lentisphaerae bacterium GWF2_49_21]|nr:MAG: aminodeoxychorismate synthase, component I [Lentisphaerae bacterium GWF2_49_21]